VRIVLQSPFFHVSHTPSPNFPLSSFPTLTGDGLLALSNLVDLDHVRLLRESMTATANGTKARQNDNVTAYNHGVRTNFLMSPPLADEALRFEDVYANPLIVAIVEGAFRRFLPFAIRCPPVSFSPFLLSSLPSLSLVRSI
jgi:hypothetical protein